MNRTFTLNSYFLANSNSIHSLFREFTSNSLSISCSRIHLEFPIFFCEFTFNSLSFSRIHLQFTTLIANSLWIYYYFREFMFHSLSSLRIHFLFTIYIVNLLLIHYLYPEFTWSFLSLSRTHYEFTTVFANLLWIPYFFAYSLLIHYEKSLLERPWSI